MTAISPSEDFEAGLRRSAALQWGWALCISSIMGGAVASYILYWWAVSMGGSNSALLADGFLCAPFCLLACIGFIQIVTGTTCNYLPEIWPTLKLWRQLLIVLFITSVIYFLLPFTYFIMTLSPPFPAGSGAFQSSPDFNAGGE